MRVKASDFLHCAAWLDFIHVMYWPFDTRWLGGNGLSLNSELRSSNGVCSLPRIAGGRISIRRGFGSTRLVSLFSGQLICDDEWGEAWKSRASRTTHQDFLIGVLAASYGRQIATMALDILVHKVRPKNVYSLSLQTIDSDYTLIDEVRVFCVWKQVL